VRDEIKRYEALGVRPFGINPASAESHATYAAKLRLPFPLLSDPGRAVSQRYGAVKAMGMGIARSVYLIGKDGKVRFAASGAPGPDLSLVSLSHAEGTAKG
jgi:peroxiredoxin Q/BCP